MRRILARRGVCRAIPGRLPDAGGVARSRDLRRTYVDVSWSPRLQTALGHSLRPWYARVSLLQKQLEPYEPLHPVQDGASLAKTRRNGSLNKSITRKGVESVPLILDL